MSCCNEKFSVKRREFLSQEESIGHRKKFPVTRRDFLSQEEIYANPVVLAKIIKSANPAVSGEIIISNRWMTRNETFYPIWGGVYWIILPEFILSLQNPSYLSSVLLH
jgi:hypothetical protein